MRKGAGWCAFVLVLAVLPLLAWAGQADGDRDISLTKSHRPKSLVPKKPAKTKSPKVSKPKDPRKDPLYVPPAKKSDAWFRAPKSTMPRTPKPFRLRPVKTPRPPKLVFPKPVRPAEPKAPKPIPFEPLKTPKRVAPKPVRTSPTVPSAGFSSGTVYVSGSGKRGKYHRDGCRYRKPTQRSISRAEAEAAGYQPCKVCGG